MSVAPASPRNKVSKATFEFTRNREPGTSVDVDIVVQVPAAGPQVPTLSTKPSSFFLISDDDLYFISSFKS